MTGHRIVTLSNGHPDLGAGGSEVAAKALADAYRDLPGVAESQLVATLDTGRAPTGALSSHAPGEWLWDTGISDWFTLRPAHAAENHATLAAFLARVQPDIVHLHHYARPGLDVIPLIRRVVPDAHIILTLHEYLGICAADGQMVTRGEGRLCTHAAPVICARCFPDRDPGQFWLRREWMLRHFALVDSFVAPSVFLRERYVAWGLSRDRVAVIGNAIAPPAAARAPRRDPDATRFAFFGRLTELKGLEVLLRAVAMLPRLRRREISVEINGTGLDRQPAAFAARIEALAAPLGAQGVLDWAGAYDAAGLSARMGRCDWVLVPSTWWENAPMVIHEAFAHGRPVVCSDIGGMAEMVRDGVDGVYVPVGSARAWADALDRLGGDHATWARLAGGIAPPPAPAEIAAAHLALVAGGR
ncbi:glycosyltransferase [Palleronia sediminis]|nr:glycosyltransferase [Palleronia sediminis]